MDKDSHLIFESVVSKYSDPRPISAYAIKELHRIHDKLNSLSTALHLAKNAEADQLLSKIRDLSDMLISEGPQGEGEIKHYGDGLERALGKEENAEDMSKSPFHYDPSEHLMQAAVQINKILQSNSDDEATPEHIEQMALKILGPQSEYADVQEFNLALRGVKALLYRYIAVQMN